MAKILLLYDTQEEDLARDLKELVTELGCEILMIPRSADLGKTLQSKEDVYFASAAGAIFLITPGAVRNGKQVPSPSLADEMGRAREHFKSTPERVIYLVDKMCHVQSVDQRSYLPFERENIRSIVSAVVGLIRNLKAAGLLGKPRSEPPSAPKVDIVQLSRTVDPHLKKICADLSDVQNGMLLNDAFERLLSMRYRWSHREINFAKRDLLRLGLIRLAPAKAPLTFTFIALTDAGLRYPQKVCK